MRGALVSSRVFEEVKLMVILCVPPRARSVNLGSNLSALCRRVNLPRGKLDSEGPHLGREVFRLNFFCDALSDGGLFGRRGEDG